MSDTLAGIVISPRASLREAMEQLNANARGIVLVVDAGGRLLATVTDGDIRRAILQAGNLALSIEETILQAEDCGMAVVAPVTTSREGLLDLMRRHTIRHIPLIDDDRRVVDLLRLEDLVKDDQTLRAVVMAGGFGTRLRPLTDELPKPMLPVGDRPLIEHIVGQLREGGVHQISISTHYRSEAIKSHLGDGSQFGVEIDYVTEDSPLGTAGALGLLEKWDTTLLVVNGDILTRLNYRAMLAFHQQHDAVLTVGVREYEVKVPYGVVETDGVVITRVNEKPVLQFFVNAGVYLLEPETRQWLDGKGRLDMTDLIRELTSAGRRVVSFPISEYWLDIGQADDYQRAQADILNGRY